MSKELKDVSMDDIEQIIINEKEKWIKENIQSTKQIKDFVFDKLNTSYNEIICKLIGFDSRWNKWEIDHCNGRIDNSPIGADIKTTIRETIIEWFHQEPKAWLKINKKELKTFQTLYKKEYMERLKREIYNKAKEDAENDAHLLVEQYNFRDKKKE